LWAKQSGSDDKTDLIAPVSALKSGVKTSTLELVSDFIAFIVSLNVLAPPSFRSSLVTEVMTTYFRPSFLTIAAIFSGSFPSTFVG